MISVIIPAHNEERLLGPTLLALNAAARQVGEPHEVIVVDDASTDRTAQVAREHGAHVIHVQHRQIAATRNAGARVARGDVFFFIDADTLANARAIRAGLRAVRKGAAGGGCVFRFDCPLPLWAQLIYPIGVVAGRMLKIVGGCFLFCSRQAFQAAGGFGERYFAAEEMAFAQSLKRHGRFVVPGGTVVTSGRKLGVVSARDVIRTLVLAAVRGAEAFQQREGLEIWYGERPRPDGTPT